MNDYVEQFWRDGYLVRSGFFDPVDVMRWREAALARGKTLADLLSDDVLREIVLHPRLITLARELLGGARCTLGTRQRLSDIMDGVFIRTTAIGWTAEHPTGRLTVTP